MGIVRARDDSCNNAVSGARVILTLSPAVAAGDRVTLSYTPGASPIRDRADNEAEPVDGRSVTNRTGAGVVDVDPPEIVDDAGEAVRRGGVAGDTVVIVYSEPLDTRVQVPTRAFVVLAPAFGGVERDVQRVDVCDERVVLTLARPVPFGFGATVAYLPPPAGQIQDRAGNRAGAEAAHGAVWNEQITDCSGRTPDVEDPSDVEDPDEPTGGGGGGGGGGTTEPDPEPEPEPEPDPEPEPEQLSVDIAGVPSPAIAGEAYELTAQSESDATLVYQWDVRGGTIEPDDAQTVVWTAPETAVVAWIHVDVTHADGATAGQSAYVRVEVPEPSPNRSPCRRCRSWIGRSSGSSCRRRACCADRRESRSSRGAATRRGGSPAPFRREAF